MLQVNNNDKVNKGYLFFYKLISSPDHSTFRTTGIFLRKGLLADIRLQTSNLYDYKLAVTPLLQKQTVAIIFFSVESNRRSPILSSPLFVMPIQ
jgi:hypothetical protein